MPIPPITLPSPAGSGSCPDIPSMANPIAPMSRAIGGGSMGDSGHVIMTTADDETAKAVLDDGGYTYIEGESILQYSYRVRDDIAPLIRDHFDIPAPKGRPPLDEVGRMLAKSDRAVLEVAATRLFLERESGLSGEAMPQNLRALKGHLASRFSDADNFLADLRKRGWLN